MLFLLRNLNFFGYQECAWPALSAWILVCYFCFSINQTPCLFCIYLFFSIIFQNKLFFMLKQVSIMQGFVTMILNFLKYRSIFIGIYFVLEKSCTKLEFVVWNFWVIHYLVPQKLHTWACMLRFWHLSSLSLCQGQFILFNILLNNRMTTSIGVKY